MIQRWASVQEQEEVLDRILDTYLEEKNLGVDGLLDSEERREELLALLFPGCRDILRSHSTTGIFLVLTGRDMEEAGDFNGFYIRDSDPYTGEWFGPASGEGKQAFVQGVECSPGYVMDYPFSYGRHGEECFRQFLL